MPLAPPSCAPPHAAQRTAPPSRPLPCLCLPQVGFDASLSGTTACCVLVVGRKVLVASTGDSRCVVARRKPGGHGSHGHGSHGGGGGCGEGASGSDVEVVPLTWDAKPSLPEEQRRIAQSGADGTGGSGRGGAAALNCCAVLCYCAWAC